LSTEPAHKASHVGAHTISSLPCTNGTTYLCQRGVPGLHGLLQCCGPPVLGVPLLFVGQTSSLFCPQPFLCVRTQRGLT
jgi:hypothetical protein